MSTYRIFFVFSERLHLTIFAIIVDFEKSSSGGLGPFAMNVWFTFQEAKTTNIGFEFSKSDIEEPLDGRICKSEVLFCKVDRIFSDGNASFVVLLEVFSATLKLLLIRVILSQLIFTVFF